MVRVNIYKKRVTPHRLPYFQDFFACVKIFVVSKDGESKKIKKMCIIQLDANKTKKNKIKIKYKNERIQTLRRQMLSKKYI